MLADAERVALSMGLDLGSVVRSAMTELVRRQALPWTPGQATHVRLHVPSVLQDPAADTVEVSVPVAILRQALQSKKAPDVEDAEGQEG